MRQRAVTAYGLGMRFYSREDFERRNDPCPCGSGKKFKSVAINNPLKQADLWCA